VSPLSMSQPPNVTTALSQPQPQLHSFYHSSI